MRRDARTSSGTLAVESIWFIRRGVATVARSLREVR
jgi:hypothetical protein